MWYYSSPPATAQALSAGLDVRFEVEVQSVTRVDGNWLISATSPEGPLQMTCEAVVLAMPPAAVQRVLREEPKLCAMIPEVKMQSCWTVVLTLKTPLDLPFEICILKQSSVLMGAIR